MFYWLCFLPFHPIFRNFSGIRFISLKPLLSANSVWLDWAIQNLISTFLLLTWCRLYYWLPLAIRKPEPGWKQILMKKSLQKQPILRQSKSDGIRVRLHLCIFLRAIILQIRTYLFSLMRPITWLWLLT
jgi:hypothetical protein